jgi:hypothetical protein
MKKDLEKHIIDRLFSGPQSRARLVLQLSEEAYVSIQGVYKALRHLKQRDVITIHNKTVSLSLIWIRSEKEKFAFAEYAYHSDKKLIDVLSKDKTKVTFTFKTLSDLDLFWTHAYTILAKRTTLATPRYMIIPHDFFLYARSETDSFWMKENITQDAITRLIVTHPFPVDKVAVRLRSSFKEHPFAYLLNENPLKQNSRTNYNVLGDYIFKGTFDTHVNRDIEGLLQTIKRLPLTKIEAERMRTLLLAKGTFTLSIEKNMRKSHKVENKLRKYFE